jgi:hypothetical protein
VKGGRFVFEERADHLDWPLSGSEHAAAGQVERRVLGVIADDNLEPPLGQAIDDTADAGSIGGAGAHAARLG